MIDKIDTIWVLFSVVLVMLMIPGLAFFYGGLIRQKNVLSTLMHSFFMLVFISIVWYLFGYSLAFSPNGNSFIGDFSYACFNNVDYAPSKFYGQTIPHQVFAIFQMMFACLTPALISGAFAERKKFTSFVAFSLLWMIFVYCPIAHWVWSEGGWLAKLGTMDFAGGTVVHISSGVSALVCAFVLGNRIDFKKQNIKPHNIPLTMIGVSLLWFGWFGFNAGSALSMNSIAMHAFTNTHIAAAAGGLFWLILGLIKSKKAKSINIGNGIVSGLVGITPAAGFVETFPAMIIGILTSTCSYICVEHIVKDRIDDSIDVFGIHGIGGITGALLTGVFASVAVNPDGMNGLMYGNPSALLIQLLSVVLTILYAGIVSFILLKIIKLFLGLRVTVIEENKGLDISIHDEIGYNKN